MILSAKMPEICGYFEKISLKPCASSHIVVILHPLSRKCRKHIAVMAIGNLHATQDESRCPKYNLFIHKSQLIHKYDESVRDRLHPYSRFV